MAKAKKWAHLRGRTTHTVVDALGIKTTFTITPRGESDDVTHSDVVRALRDKWKTLPFEEQLDAWNVFEGKKAAIERELSEINANITAIERNAFEHMDGRNIE